MAVKNRLQALDLLRGFTVAAMILVNNGYKDSFEMLQHADWNGLSVSDFVFPFFLFIMGVSIFLSFSKNKFKISKEISWKIIKRTLILFILGLVINWLEMICHGNGLNFQELRFWAVLQRIAICYFVSSFFVLLLPKSSILPIAFLALIIYGFIITNGNGYSSDKALNILYLTDEKIFGDSHLYHKSVVDPEGLISTISALSNVLFGVYVGLLICKANNLLSKSNSCFVFGALLLILGFIVNFFMPANKHIWSPSFALITSGACALFLGLFISLETKDSQSGGFSVFFKVFGVNALLLYITSEVMAILFGTWGINEALYGFYSFGIPYPPLASLFYALTYVLMNWLIGYPLWRKHIYIKL